MNGMAQHGWEMGARRTTTMTRQQWEHTTISNTDGRVAMASTMVVVPMMSDEEVAEEGRVHDHQQSI